MPSDAVDDTLDSPSQQPSRRDRLRAWFAGAGNFMARIFGLARMVPPAR